MSEASTKVGVIGKSRRRRQKSESSTKVGVVDKIEQIPHTSYLPIACDPTLYNVVSMLCTVYIYKHRTHLYIYASLADALTKLRTAKVGQGKGK